jgi:hypothetical protein
MEFEPVIEEAQPSHPINDRTHPDHQLAAEQAAGLIAAKPALPPGLEHKSSEELHDAAGLTLDTLDGVQARLDRLDARYREFPHDPLYAEQRLALLKRLDRAESAATTITREAVRRQDAEHRAANPLPWAKWLPPREGGYPEQDLRHIDALATKGGMEPNDLAGLYMTIEQAQRSQLYAEPEDCIAAIQRMGYTPQAAEQVRADAVAAVNVLAPKGSRAWAWRDDAAIANNPHVVIQLANMWRSRRLTR